MVALALKALVSGVIMSLVHRLLVPPPMPQLDLPIAARYLPTVKQTINQAITGFYFVGAADGLGIGITLGVVLTLFLLALLWIFRSFLSSISTTFRLLATRFTIPPRGLLK